VQLKCNRIILFIFAMVSFHLLFLTLGTLLAFPIFCLHLMFCVICLIFCIFLCSIRFSVIYVVYLGVVNGKRIPSTHKNLWILQICVNYSTRTVINTLFFVEFKMWQMSQSMYVLQITKCNSVGMTGWPMKIFLTLFWSFWCIILNT